MATPDKSNDDCYFYFYSSCTKGEECPFRHCEAALGTETVCSLWRDGRCFRKMCKFRHMENRKNRSMIPCYWENQPGGCRKPHCVFFHHRPRFSITEALTEKPDGMILPVSSYPQSPGVSPTVPDLLPENTLFIPQENTEDLNVSQVSQIVQPLVVNFDEEGEESDTESTASTPVKVPSLSGNHLDATAEKCHPKLLQTVEEYENRQDIGIKTLEQIKMEKVHKESEYIYCTEYPVEGSGIQTEDETCAVEDKSVSSPVDLRDHLKHKRTLQTVENTSKSEIQDENDTLPKKRRIISLKKENAEKESTLDKWLRKDAGRFAQDEKESVEIVVPQQDIQSRQPQDQKTLNFGIKTLAEIRQEKESKQVTPNNTAESPVKKETKDTAETKRKRIILKKPSFGTIHSEDDHESRKNLKITFAVNDHPRDEFHSESEFCKAPTVELNIETKDHISEEISPKVSPKRRLKRKSLELYSPPKLSRSSFLNNEDKTYLQKEDNSMSLSKKLHTQNRISGELTDLNSNQENSSDNLKKKVIHLRRKRFDVPGFIEHDITSGQQNTEREISSLSRNKQNSEMDDEIPWPLSSEYTEKSQLNVSTEQEKIERREKLSHPVIQRQPLSLKNLVTATQEKSTADNERVSDTSKQQVSPAEENHCAQKTSESTVHTKQNSDQERTSGNVLEDSIVNSKPASIYKDKLNSPPLISLDQAKRESRSSTLSSADDELDSLLLGSKNDLGLFIDDVSLEDKGEDELLLELEKIINS